MGLLYLSRTVFCACALFPTSEWDSGRGAAENWKIRRRFELPKRVSFSSARTPKRFPPAMRITDRPATTLFK
jgi:hypothetical protein